MIRLQINVRTFRYLDSQTFSFFKQRDTVIRVVEAAVRFLSSIKGRRTAPVPMPDISDRGVHIIVTTFGVGGIIAVSKELIKLN